jgi:hypothetical protein
VLPRRFQIYRVRCSPAMTGITGITSVLQNIFVEHGGEDGSWPIIAGLARADHRVRGLRMSRIDGSLERPTYALSSNGPMSSGSGIVAGVGESLPGLPRKTDD